MASHFDLTGKPDGWSKKETYVAFMIGFQIYTNVIVAGVYALIPKLWPTYVNIPYKKYWMETPERELEGKDRLRMVLALTGIFMAVVAGMVHGIVYLANTGSFELTRFYFIPTLLALVGLLIFFIIRLTLPPR